MSKKEVKQEGQIQEPIQAVRNEKMLGALCAIIVLLIVALFACAYTFLFSGRFLVLKRDAIQLDNIQKYVHGGYDSEYIDESLLKDDRYYDEGEFLYDGAPIDSVMNSK